MNTSMARLVLFLALALTPALTQAEGLVFGLVGKSIDDINFVAAGKGCAEEAKRSGDQCLLIGNRGPADYRLQVQAIADAVRNTRFAALAISVTASEAVARAVQALTIPVITFDSPFKAGDAALSRAYVGTENVEFGRELARIARKLRPQGGSVCLMTAANDGNLAQRVQGLRMELSGQDQRAEGQRLNGEGGWSETERCPWNSADKNQRTLSEVEFTLKHLHPDVFISVGHWPVSDPAAFRKTVAPFSAAIMAQQPVLIIAVGKILPDYAALFDEHLVHGFVSINFEEIGRQSYALMKAVANGQAVPATTPVPSLIQYAK